MTSVYPAITTCELTTRPDVIDVSVLTSPTSVSAPPGDATRYHVHSSRLSHPYFVIVMRSPLLILTEARANLTT